MKVKNKPKILTYLLFSSIVFPAWSSDEQVELLNINTASAKEIARALDGIGIKKAQSLVNYRLKHGDFSQISEMELVPGISKNLISRNRKKIDLEHKERH